MGPRLAFHSCYALTCWARTWTRALSLARLAGIRPSQRLSLDDTARRRGWDRSIHGVEETDRSRERGKEKAPEANAGHLKQCGGIKGVGVPVLPRHRSLAFGTLAVPAHAPRCTLRAWLQDLGCSYKGGKKGFAPTEALKARVRGYLMDHLPRVRACTRVGEAGRVTTSMDESSCHENYGSQTPW